MFISNDTDGFTYNRNGEQFSKGMFLILMTDRSAPMVNGKYHVRGIVRYVTLTQFGHWMMGSCTIGTHKFTLSGAYGQDGLLLDVDSDTFERGIDLPDALYDAWSNGGGHNSSGNETQSMRAWARQNIVQLYDVKRPCMHAFKTFASVRDHVSTQSRRLAYRIQRDIDYSNRY